jgi:hypothetical protein
MQQNQFRIILEVKRFHDVMLMEFHRFLTQAEHIRNLFDGPLAE